jgi:hypothetical protein
MQLFLLGDIKLTSLWLPPDSLRHSFNMKLSLYSSAARSIRPGAGKELWHHHLDQARVNKDVEIVITSETHQIIYTVGDHSET